MFYLDRKVRGTFIPVTERDTRKLKLFEHKGDALEYAANWPRIVHRVGKIKACRN